VGLTKIRVNSKVWMITRKDKKEWILQFFHTGVLTARDQETPRLSVCDTSRNLWSYSLITFPFSLFFGFSTSGEGIYLFIIQWYIFSDSGASHLQSCTLWTYPSCPIKNKHPEKRLVHVLGPEIGPVIIFGRITKLLLTSAPWGAGKEYE